jgi:hypothetical protein
LLKGAEHLLRSEPRQPLLGSATQVDEKAVLDRVVSAWTDEKGVEVTASALIRALIKREAKALGLDDAPKPPAKSAPKPSPNKHR